MKKIIYLLLTTLVFQLNAQEFEEGTKKKSGFYVGGSVSYVNLDVNHNMHASSSTIMMPFGWEYIDGAWSLSEEDNDVGGILHVGYNITENHAIELSIGFNEWEAKENVRSFGTFTSIFLSPGNLVNVNDEVTIDHKLRINPIMLTYKYNKEINDKVSLFGGIGAGVILGDYDQTGLYTDYIAGASLGTSGGDSDQALAAQLMLGGEFKFNDRVSFRGSYRYMKSGSMKFNMVNPEPFYPDPEVSVKLSNHYIDGGLQFLF